MQWGILGPLSVVEDDGTEIVVPAGRLRVLLAALLTRANHLVPVDELVEILWGGTPPANAARTMRVYVVRLRQALGPVAAARIVTQMPGYLCQTSEDELDLLRFESLSGRARSAAADQKWSRTADLLTEALALWRGTPLVDVPSDLLRDREIPRLEQLRLHAIEDHIDAESHLGHHDHLIPRLRDLTAQHPLREHLHAQLMYALARTGRRAEALEAYQHARRVLIDQLGIEPGPELQQLQERILAGNAEPLPLSADDTAPAADQPSAPRQLPATMRHFVGRERELGLLSSLLTQQGDAGGPVVISAINGTAGIGKTALAVHWAHQHADRFPDGQLYVDLRGFGPGGVPVPPAAAVRGLLIALGVPAPRVPVDLHEQAALYRSQLADRRMLVLLDNARDAEQVRPLLPGSPGCLVLVTSRNQLAGLVALDGAVPVSLDLLTESEARELLLRRLGSAHLDLDDDAVTELIALCARLPLALSIAAAHAALHPTRPVAALVEELRDGHRRLDTLTTGDAAADVRAVFSWSYHTLSPDTARTFRLLGLHPGPDVSVLAAASLTALDPDSARRALAELMRAYLITEHAPGRFRFHDLLRAYAADEASVHDTDAERQEALLRMRDFYTHTAHAADLLLAPHRPPIPLDPSAPGTAVAPMSDMPAALAWFDAEHANLMAVQQIAATHEWHATVWQLAWCLAPFLSWRGHRHDDLTVWQAALTAAEHLPDPTIRIRAHRILGHAYAKLDGHEEASDHMQRALELAEQADATIEQAHTHNMLVRAWELRGDDQKAMYHATRAVDLYRDLDQEVLMARALNHVGWFAARLGDYDAARGHCQDALVLHRQHHNPDGEAATLDSLAYIDHRTGRHREAIDHYQQALTLFRSLGDTYESADVLDRLGSPHVALDQREQARAVWRQALELYRSLARPQDAERVRRQLAALDR